MITDIQNTLEDIDARLDNIKELVFGLNEEAAEKVLKSVVEASDALDRVYDLMLEEPLW